MAQQVTKMTQWTTDQHPVKGTGEIIFPDLTQEIGIIEEKTKIGALNAVLEKLFEYMGSSSQGGGKITISGHDFQSIKMEMSGQSIGLMEAIAKIDLGKLDIEKEVTQEVDLAMTSISRIEGELMAIRGKLEAILKIVKTITDVQGQFQVLLKALKESEFTFEATEGSGIRIEHEGGMKCIDIPELIVFIEEARRRQLEFQAEMREEWRKKMTQIFEKHQEEVMETSGVFISREIEEYSKLLTGFATKHACKPGQTGGQVSGGSWGQVGTSGSGSTTTYVANGGSGGSQWATSSSTTSGQVKQPGRKSGVVRMKFKADDIRSILVRYPFHMTFRLSNKALTERGGKLYLEEKKSSITDDQLWNLKDDTIISISSNMALEVTGGSAKKNAEIKLAKKTGSAAQKWGIGKDGLLTTELGAGDLVLDVKGNKLVLNDRDKHSRQDWDLQFHQ